MKPFYERHSWAIATQNYSYMIDTLANKTNQLVPMKSDPNMLCGFKNGKDK
jgi:hypothetical protein